jgi:hypothetical protein
MRKPFFRHLLLEELEDRRLTNMPFGHLGTPVFGLAMISPANQLLDGSSLVCSSEKAIESSEGNSRNWLVTKLGEYVPAISGTQMATNSGQGFAHEFSDDSIAAPISTQASETWAAYASNRDFFSDPLAPEFPLLAQPHSSAPLSGEHGDSVRLFSLGAGSISGLSGTGAGATWGSGSGTSSSLNGPATTQWTFAPAAPTIASSLPANVLLPPVAHAPGSPNSPPTNCQPSVATITTQ